MLTTTHMLVGAAALSRPYHGARQIMAAWVGGFFPDASVFAMVAVSRMTGMGAANLWRAPEGMYWQQPWQLFSAVSNSMPIYITLIAAGYFWRRFRPEHASAALMIMLFGGAALLHVMLDFPVHTDDAHVHFWPFTDWRFHSPVSYYRRSQYGDIVGAIELVVGVGLAIYLCIRFSSWRVRLAAVACAVPYFMSLRFLF